MSVYVYMYIFEFSFFIFCTDFPNVRKQNWCEHPIMS